MTPELRAIADRFIYETATMKHMLSLFPDGAAGRAVHGHQDGWTVRQLVAHLAESLHTYTIFLDNVLAGREPDFGVDDAAMDSPMSHPEVPLIEVSRRFDSGIRVLFDCFDGIPDEALGPDGIHGLPGVLQTFNGHALSDIIPLVDAVPEVRMDPLVLNWLLEAELQDEASREWQNALLAEAQEYIASHADEEDEEDEKDE